MNKRTITQNTIRQSSAGMQKQFLSCRNKTAFVALPGIAAAAERTVINITVRSAAFSI